VQHWEAGGRVVSRVFPIQGEHVAAAEDPLSVLAVSLTPLMVSMPW